jgi:hypothetical protein
MSKVAYLIGGNSVHVIDVSSAAVDVTSSTARVLPILLTRDLPTTITDVVMCGDLIAISAEGSSKVSPGQVLLYSRYLRSGSADSLKLMANFTVGEYCWCYQWLLLTLMLPVVEYCCGLTLQLVSTSRPEAPRVQQDLPHPAHHLFTSNQVEQYKFTLQVHRGRYPSIDLLC